MKIILESKRIILRSLKSFGIPNSFFKNQQWVFIMNYLKTKNKPVKTMQMAKVISELSSKIKCSYQILINKFKKIII